MSSGHLSCDKANRAWVWVALCRKTRQIVAYAVGDRSKNTCQKLWDTLPEVYQSGHCFTDFWQAYQAVIPEEQHSSVGKETRETAHIERWNTTLRQRLGRFVREMLSFSRIKCDAYRLLGTLSPSLQSRKGHHSQVSHYQRDVHFLPTLGGKKATTTRGVVPGDQ